MRAFTWRLHVVVALELVSVLVLVSAEIVAVVVVVVVALLRIGSRKHGRFQEAAIVSAPASTTETPDL